METINIIISGVGGQGIILASKILAECVFRDGFDVKENELHGMAQRGGSVLSHIRFGGKIYSPLIRRGKADYLIAMEELEGLRYLYFLKPGGTVILNKRRKKPESVTSGISTYPDQIMEQIEKMGYHVDEINAFDIAKKSGSPKSENIVLLGLLSNYISLKESTWLDVIQKAVPKKTIDANLKAFKAGHDLLADKKL